MKLNLLAAALFAFHTALSHAAPSPELPQLKLSIDVPESAVAPTTNVLLVFAGNQPARFGNFYSVNATIDGAEFTIENSIEIWSVSQYYYGNCTVNSKDGRSFSLINYGITYPVVQNMAPATAFIGGSCSDPYTGEDNGKFSL